MKLENVRAIIPSLGVDMVLNKFSTKIERATLVGGTVIIDRTSDKLIGSRLDNCKIISHVPLTVDYCYIDPMNIISQTERIEKDTPHALIRDCFFRLCLMPKGDYGNNCIKGKPQSSEGKTSK